MLFSFNDIKSSNISNEVIGENDKKQSNLVANYLQLHSIALNNINELNNKLPSPDELYFIWTIKSFNAFTFIQYIISKLNCINELYITSYNMSQLVISALMTLVDEGAILNLHIVLSDIAKSRFPKTYELLSVEAGKRENVTVGFKWNHSKVALAYCNNDYFILEGSGNFSDNARHEQYLFANSKYLYEFRKNWIINDI